MYFNNKLPNHPTFVYDEKTKTLKKPEKGIMNDSDYSMLLLFYNEALKEFEKNKNDENNKK